MTAIFINNSLFFSIMTITVLEQKKNKLSFEINADNTFCNIFKKELWNDKDVHVSGYYIEHIQTGKPRFVVETTDKDPLDALRDGVKRLKKMNANFLDAFSEAK